MTAQAPPSTAENETDTHAGAERLAKEAVAEPAARVEEALRSSIEALIPAGELREAMIYSALGPGKRLRPALAWHSAGACGVDPRVAMPACVAIEMVHAFSLVHDDLPGLDDDDMRRGRPTLHRATSEAMAVLAGDALLNTAYAEITAEVGDGALAGELVRELSCATNAMILGQVYDTLGGLPPGVEGVERPRLVHMNKTGALIRAACRMGARLALGPGVNDQHAAFAAITTFAESVGLMFQVVDDLLDVTQTSDHLGKASGKDAAAGKLTYPGELGVDGARAEVERLRSAAMSALHPLGESAEPLRRITSYLAVRTR